MNAIFFTRHQCPLCEDAWALMDQALESLENPPVIRRVNIDTETELVRVYGWRIPVLKLEDGREYDLAIAEQAESALSVLRCLP